jgi:hypothetical protein
MGARFASVDRDTPMLLPPDLRNWGLENDLGHFVAMRDKLPTEEGKALYGRRNHTDEPVFGTVKAAMVFPGFSEIPLRIIPISGTSTFTALPRTIAAGFLDGRFGV